VYSWIWSHLPFGLRGKIAGSLLLATAAGALLWYVVFPWAEPLLPFDDVQVTQDSGVSVDQGGPGDPGNPGAGSPSPGATATDDPYAVPYRTDANNPHPSETPNG
jgi:hypothetical protein